MLRKHIPNFLYQAIIASQTNNYNFPKKLIWLNTLESRYFYYLERVADNLNLGMGEQIDFVWDSPNLATFP